MNTAIVSSGVCFPKNSTANLYVAVRSFGEHAINLDYSVGHESFNNREHYVLS